MIFVHISEQFRCAVDVMSRQARWPLRMLIVVSRRWWSKIARTARSWATSWRRRSVPYRQELPQDDSSKTTRLRYNCDVLECILQQLQAQDLYAAALVCRDWALAARRPLYSRVNYDTDLKSAPLLANTLRTCSHLRRLVRSLKVHIDVDDDDTSRLDWLHLMPEEGVHDLHVRQFSMDKDFTTFILQSPFILYIRRLKGEAEFIRTKEHLLGCLALPHLKSLTLDVPDEIEVPGPLSAPMSLGSFLFHSWSFPTYGTALLDAMGAQLDELVVDTTANLMPNDQVPAFLATLGKHFRHLRRLTVRAKASPWSPYLHRISHLTPSLEYLHLGPGIYSPDLFSDLPRCLHTLRLEHGRPRPFPFNAMEHLVARAGRGDIALQSLTVFVKNGDYDDLSKFGHLQAMCPQCGVDFELKVYDGTKCWWDFGGLALKTSSGSI
ncbi:hypothetical protein OBBRIDRAFT_405243 [Obba rivulosa]|uniref:F-box domain-containing protein n=1 Tax=Obba rivulosa TaxID=1052685 RepID=A0A8E2AXD8_9APHY|nr:hypothetical protein OBBRIDRAFT_405243 [Obba rivulosa]